MATIEPVRWNWEGKGTHHFNGTKGTKQLGSKKLGRIFEGV
jgi:hypothetical protein